MRDLQAQGALVAIKALPFSDVRTMISEKEM